MLKRVIAKMKEGHKLIVHKCSMCNYPCGYFWSIEGVAYDNGCDCTMFGEWTPRSEWELEEYIAENPSAVQEFLE